MTKAAILVVDDEKGVQSALQGILEDAGFDAEGVSSGEECLTSIAAREYAIR